MRRLLIGICLTLLISGCSAKDGTNTLKVGATEVPHAEILEFVQPLLRKEGIELEIVVYHDYIQPNLNLNDGEIDANFFQHHPYLEQFNEDYSLELVALANVHIEPMGIYSVKFETLRDIASGSKVLIPGDPTNGGRALALLETAGLLSLKEGTGIWATPGDVAANPLNLEIIELDAAFITNALPDAGLAVVNTNFAIQAGLVPSRDALHIEGGESPFVNILVGSKGAEAEEMVQRLAEILTSAEVAQFITETYQGQVVPVN